LEDSEALIEDAQASVTLDIERYTSSLFRFAAKNIEFKYGPDYRIPSKSPRPNTHAGFFRINPIEHPARDFTRSPIPLEKNAGCA
jgi:hypothetical protein